MQLLGYILFTFTGLFYLGMTMLNLSKPSLGGDNAMGYGLLVVYLGIGFTISSLILTIILRSIGDSNWVFPDLGAGTRTTLILLGWLFTSLTLLCCTIFRWEWHEETLYPQFLHWLAIHYGQVWIPLPWLIACFLSLNPNWQASLSLPLFKIPLWAGLSLSALVSGGLLVGYLRDSAQRAEAEIATRISDEQRWHQTNLTEISAHKPDDPIVGLLVFTTRFQPDDIRQAALAKLKAHHDWEAKLLELLANTYYYREVYSFLGSNSVEHPEAFVKPLILSMTRLSATIKAEIEDSNNLQDWQFDSYGIGHLLRAIDNQFQNQIIDFHPSVVQLKQALNTTPPERFKGVRFTVTAEVDRWLNEHKSTH